MLAFSWYNLKMKTNRNVFHRVSYIDRARGIAMLLMIVGHTLPGMAGPFEQGVLDVACPGGGGFLFFDGGGSRCRTDLCLTVFV